jgi:hypothetical protein
VRGEALHGIEQRPRRPPGGDAGSHRRLQDEQGRDAKSSGRHLADLISSSSGARTELSSSTTKTRGMTSGIEVTFAQSAAIERFMIQGPPALASRLHAFARVVCDRLTMP